MLFTKIKFSQFFSDLQYTLKPPISNNADITSCETDLKFHLSLYLWSIHSICELQMLLEDCSYAQTHMSLHCSTIWASTPENLSLGFVNNKGADQPAHPQSDRCDQRLCYSLIRKLNFNFLAGLCSWGDLFESRFVRNPEDRFCRIEAHYNKYQNLMCPGSNPYW